MSSENMTTVYAQRNWPCPSNDLQTPPPSKKSCFDFLSKRTLNCSETNEKSVFQFLLFSFLRYDRFFDHSIHPKNVIVPKDGQYLKRIFELLSFFFV